MNTENCKIEMIDVNCIRVVNSRNRDAKKYNEIITSIESLGLKTPIVVSEREKLDGKQFYDLVCGEGRLNAYKQERNQRLPLGFWLSEMKTFC